jgi:hypothetical protein
MAQILCLSLGAVLFYGSAIFLLVTMASLGDGSLPNEVHQYSTVAAIVALYGTCYVGLFVGIDGYYRFATEA